MPSARPISGPPPRRGKIAAKSAGAAIAIETGDEGLAPVTSYVHDLLRRYEYAILDEPNDPPEMRSWARVRRLASARTCRQVEAHAYALSVAGEILMRIGGRRLVNEIIHATERHYGLAAALLLGRQWAEHGRWPHEI